MEKANHLLERVLRECHTKAPASFYPTLDAKDYDRVELDEALDQLRLGGLIQMTPWEAGRGQGYKLTPAGEEVLQSPRSLSRLQTRGVQPKPVERPVPAEGGHAETPWERGEAIRSVLRGGHTPVITFTLIALNALVFSLGLAMAVSRGIPPDRYLMPSRDDPQINQIYYITGQANPGSILIAGEWWRLIGYQFVHGGIIHLLFNMLFLFNVGQLLETMWGRFRFLALYLISGVGGGAGALLANSGVVGASGALCGIFASLVVWILWNRTHLPPQVVSIWLRQLFINAIIIGVISVLPGISGSGHLGGAIAGAVVSVPLMYTRFGNGWQRVLGWIGVAIVPTACVLAIEFSQTEEVRARGLTLAIGHAMDDAIDGYNRVTVNLVKNPDAILSETAERTRAKSLLSKAEISMDAARTRFEEALPFRDPDLQASFLDAKQYLAVWDEILKNSLNCLKNDACTPEQRRHLADLAARMQTLREKLDSSPFRN